MAIEDFTGTAVVTGGASRIGLATVRQGKRELTLAPNPDIALRIERTRDDPDRAEDGAGRAYYRRMHSQEQA